MTSHDVTLAALYIDLIGRAEVHKWGHQVACGEVENETKGDRNGQSGQRLAEYGQQEQREAETLYWKRIVFINLIY